MENQKREVMCANKLLLADKDLEYSRAFAKAITNMHKEIEITITNLDDPIDFMGYDLILTGGVSEESLKNIIRNRHSKEYFVILADDATMDLKKQYQEEGEHFWQVYKYQNLERIISDLDFIISCITGKKKVYRKDTETSMVGFLSGGGGAGRTVLAIAASRELVRHHNKKVLYLSFEEIPATELYFGKCSGTRNISDFLYFLLEKNNEAVCSHLESFLCTDEYGVETIMTSEGINDLSLLGREETERFIQTILDSKRYDHIVLDLKNDVTEHVLQLVDLCRSLILIQSSDTVSRFKTDKLVHILDKEGILERHGDHILVTNRSLENVPDESYEQDGQAMPRKDQQRITIGEDRCSFHCRSDKLEIDICGSFGLGIKKLAEEILVSKR